MKYLLLSIFILFSNLLTVTVYHKLYAPPIPVSINVNAIIKDKLDLISKSDLAFDAKAKELEKFSQAFDKALNNFAKQHKLIIFNKGAVVSGAEDYTKKLQ